MTTPQDKYWDDLGLAWTAVEPDPATLTPRLQAKLRRQSLLITLALVTGVPLTAAALALAAYTLWLGATTEAWNFVIRGVALALIALMMGRGVWALLPVSSGEAAKPLLALLELAIARAQRTLTLLRLGLYACVVAGVLGLAGTAVRTYLAGPPQQSPMIDLALLGLFALVLGLAGRQVKAYLAKLQVLRQQFMTERG